MTVIKGFLIVLFGEMIIHLLLYMISKWIGKSNKDRISFTSVLKGLLERTFVVVTLHFAMVSALTLLGALKIATRIKDEDKVSNDFFLIGNLISVLFGILYFVILKGILN